MADETIQDQTSETEGAATPNRDRRHEPPIIDGDIVEKSENIEAARVQAEPQAAVPPTIVKSSRPVLSTAIGAIVGAVVAAGAVWLAGQRPTLDPAVASRIEALEKSASGQQSAAATLDKRLSALETASTAEGAYGQRITALESAALSAKAASDANANALAEAQAARSEAAKALALATSAAQSASASPSAPAATTEGGAAPDVAALTSRLAKLEADITAMERTATDLSALAQRLDKLETAYSAPKNETRVSPENLPAGRDWAATAVVAQALSERLVAGAPFPLEEAALERLGADAAKLAPLKPLAEAGAPTTSALAAEFAKASPAILSAAAPKPPDGIVDRLMANMSKVVRVTPVGEVAGDDPAALVSQIGASLDRGQIAAALATWSRLPESGKQASQEWARKAQLRQSADAAAQSLLDDALTHLATAKN